MHFGLAAVTGRLAASEEGGTRGGYRGLGMQGATEGGGTNVLAGPYSATQQTLVGACGVLSAATGREQ